MRIENDDYLKHFISEYRKSIECEEDKMGLKAILDYSLKISDDRDEFFEMLSYGNFRLTNYDGETDKANFLKNLEQEMNMERAKYRAHKRVSRCIVKLPEPKETNPYVIQEKKESSEVIRKELANLPEEESKVINEIFFNDAYIATIAKEMQKTKEYILSLTKSALIHMNMSAGMRLDHFYNNEDMLNILESQEECSKKHTR